MPFQSNEELPKGVKGLPSDQQTKWRKVFNNAYEGTCKNSGKNRDSCASKVAWSQIDDKYKGKSYVEFSMVIRDATHDKKQGTFRWKAVASDVDEDFYHDNMSLELFNDFTKRIQINEFAPEEFRSSFWQGGMPYLSVSHYTDLEGKAVPGPVERVYIDGAQLKADGQFDKTPLGLSCYYAICKDLFEAEKPENPIRVSIGFLDYGHIHKSNNYEFIREGLDDICPECLKERFTGEEKGKIFQKGQLVHLALTRVPANERTKMEVEKSMTTRKEDAASIIGEELADEIEEEAKLVGKSQALIIKSENVVEETTTEEEPAELVEEAKKPKQDAEDQQDQGVDENSEDQGADGKKKKMSKKFAALESKDLDDLKILLSQIQKSVDAIVPEKTISQSVLEHELDTVFSQFKAAFDEIKARPLSVEDKLVALQEPFNEVGQEIRSRMQATAPVQETVDAETASDLAQTLSLAIVSAMKPMQEKLDLLLTQQKDVVKSIPATPVRRSITPTLSMQADIKKSMIATKKQSETPKLRALIEKSVGSQ